MSSTARVTALMCWMVMARSIRLVCRSCLAYRATSLAKLDGQEGNRLSRARPARPAFLTGLT